MGKKVESYQSEDGKLFSSERDMLVHEATVALTEEFPTLKMSIPVIMQNVDRIATILKAIGSHIPEPKGSHASGPMLESEDGKCIICRRPGLCSKGCPNEAGRIAQHGGQVHCRVAHPPGTRCPACADVPKGVTVIPQPEARARG